jgi:ABC-type glutathione transport system ATPase component
MRVAETLEVVGLSATYASRRPHQLSGGQRQRVAVARAIILRPALILADEPTSALDVSVQAQILALLQKTNRELGLACVFVSHNLGVIRAIANRVAVMRGGRILETGAAASKRFATGTRWLSGKDFTAVDDVSLRVAGSAIGAPSPRPRAVDRRPRSSSKPITSPIASRPIAGRRDHERSASRGSRGLAPGETLGIVGESGSGKSTLLRMIPRLIRPSGGEILFEGKDVWRLSGRELLAVRRRMQAVFQDPASSFNPRHSIGAILARHAPGGSPAAGPAYRDGRALRKSARPAPPRRSRQRTSRRRDRTARRRRRDRGL